MSSKELTIEDYFSFPCKVCGGRRHYIEERGIAGMCFVCWGCARGINVRITLAEQYNRDLARVRSDRRKKLLDMMARDVIRKYKQRAEGGVRGAAEGKQQKLIEEGL